LSLSRVNRADGSALGRRPNTPSNMISRPVELHHSKPLENLLTKDSTKRDAICYRFQTLQKLLIYNPMSINVKFVLHFFGVGFLISKQK
jgi:hypothetical protein